MPRGYPGTVHGTISHYIKRKCRCDECREAWNVHHREYMARNEDQRERHKARERARYAARVTVRPPSCTEARNE